MNPHLQQLQPYPFQRLNRLIAGITPNPQCTPISLSIGEPQHPYPSFVRDALIHHLEGLSHYPASRGEQQLREAIASWLQQRFHLPAASVDPDSQILPAAGTREALFAIAGAVVDVSVDALVAMPNPGYQIYEGAALLAGARPLYLECNAATGMRPDLDAVPARDWNRCQLLYLCTPNNPTGAVLDMDYLQHALHLAEQYDFVIACDECYSEIYPDDAAPPTGLLEAAHAAGNTGFHRCLVFHSLSKRSNLPGLRSGFVAGAGDLIDAFARYRTYHGATLAPPTQAASTAAWSDEQHVRVNRQRYRDKFARVVPLLADVCEVQQPAGAFYLWPRFAQDDEQLTRHLLETQNLRVVPGRYLARDAGSGNPGVNRLRLSLVAGIDDCIEAAQRIRRALGQP